LGEDKPELIESVVRTFGRKLALNLYRLVQQTEAKGGMVINVSSNLVDFLGSLTRDFRLQVLFMNHFHLGS
jgi:ABC-type phosphonate transport system ATPase subunit